MHGQGLVPGGGHRLSNKWVYSLSPAGVSRERNSTPCVEPGGFAGRQGGVCGQAQAISIACSFCVKRHANHALLVTAGDPRYGGIPSCQSYDLVDATGAHIACEGGVTRESGLACGVSHAGGRIAAFHCCCGSNSSCGGGGPPTTRHGGCSRGPPWARCHGGGDESKEIRNIGD
jgi:hypothetical protein